MLPRPVVILLLACATVIMVDGWFFECDDLEPEEYEKKRNCWTTTETVTTDSTPTSSTKKSVKKIFQEKTKRVMIGLTLQMKQQRFTFRLGNVSVQHQVLEGMLVVLECPGVKKESKQLDKVKWFFSGIEIGADLLSWRVKQNDEGQLELWPTVVRDSGRFECYFDEEWRGQISLLVVSLADAIHTGLTNFLYSTPFALFTLAIVIGELLFCPFRQSKVIVDPMIEFNERQLALTDKEYSERITGTITGITDDGEQQYSTSSTTTTSRSTRHAIETLMLIERPPPSSRPKVVVNTRQPSHLTHPSLIAEDEATPGISRAEYADRRRRLFESFVRSCALHGAVDEDQRFLVLLCGSDMTYSAPDVPNPFRQCSNMFYLSGLQEPGACLAITGTTKGDPRTTLFVQRREAHKELWDGPLAGVDGASYLTGVDDVFEHQHFGAFLEMCVPSKGTVIAAYDPTQWTNKKDDILVRMRDKIRLSGDPLLNMIHRLRWIKSPAEIALMRKTCAIGSSAVAATIARTRPGMNENVLVGRMEMEVRSRGARTLAYPPVIAGGNRANTIHYLNTDQTIEDGDMILMDAGCDYHGYVSDITRTWPASGRFNETQRLLYEALDDVQQKLLTFVRDRRPLLLSHVYFEMLTHLGRNLQEIGLFPSHLNEEELKHMADHVCPHHVSHYLGLDVHDTSTVARSIPVEPGVIITVEPGVYLNENDENIPERFRGIGIRIEDDVLITSTGAEVLTETCPTHIADIEALFHRI
uniref:Aminopeptidase P N-terminal domain-containing protein n=1 Tax=Plectus sambesii TaxID=2011161 RepID=A0A914W4Y2_9BILA